MKQAIWGGKQENWFMFSREKDRQTHEHDINEKMEGLL